MVRNLVLKKIQIWNTLKITICCKFWAKSIPKKHKNTKIGKILQCAVNHEALGNIPRIKTSWVNTRVKFQFHVKVRSKLCRACWTKASRHFYDTYQTPSSELPDTYQTPSRQNQDSNPFTFLEVETYRPFL